MFEAAVDLGGRVDVQATANESEYEQDTGESDSEGEAPKKAYRGISISSVWVINESTAIYKI